MSEKSVSDMKMISRRKLAPGGRTRSRSATPSTGSRSASGRATPAATPPVCASRPTRWIHDREIAAICADTWGCEVRPNESTEAQQPWHWVVIPIIGITMGEIFYVKELAEDCAKDGIYEFFFCAPPLPISRGVGSPINPMAIK